MERVVFLVDMNAFFISCEMTRNRELIGKPAAVAGDPSRRTGIILAANYEARSYGVKTAMVLHEALKLCPDMQLVPPDHSFYQKMSHEVMQILYNYTPSIEKNSIDEAWLDMSGTEALFGKPVQAAETIMADIKTTLGLWCSIGISDNKFLAKMASDMKKPLGITELWLKDVQYKLWPLPVNNMYGIGSKTASKLKGLGIQTIGDLAGYDRGQLIKSFGKVGEEYHLKANGIDDSPILLQSEDIKSIGRSTTLPQDSTDLDYLKLVLMALAEDVGMTARRNDKRGRTIHLTIKFSSFESISRQMTIPATCATKDIFGAGLKLLRDNLNKNKPIRLIGISLGGFEDQELHQLSLFEDTIEDARYEKIDRVMDEIRDKYGLEKVQRAALIKKS